MENQCTTRFYQCLGILFYAIAGVDSRVSDKELETLQEIVKKDWLALDSTANGDIDVEALIVNTFKWLHLDNEYNAEVCYDNFIKFKAKNEQLFNNEINTLILKTATKIADSFRGKNKAELTILKKLNLELKK